MTYNIPKSHTPKRPGTTYLVLGIQQEEFIFLDDFKLSFIEKTSDGRVKTELSDGRIVILSTESQMIYDCEIWVSFFQRCWRIHITAPKTVKIERGRYRKKLAQAAKTLNKP